MASFNIKEVVNQAKKDGVELLIVIKPKGQAPQMGSTCRTSELATQIGQAVSIVVNALYTKDSQFTRDEILSAVEAAAHAHAIKLLKDEEVFSLQA